MKQCFWIYKFIFKAQQLMWTCKVRQQPMQNWNTFYLYIFKDVLANDFIHSKLGEMCIRQKEHCLYNIKSNWSFLSRPMFSQIANTCKRKKKNQLCFRYNKSQARTRNSVERVFGIWKRRFPCLQMKLQIETDTSLTVITACAALHNLSRILRDPCPPSAPPHTAPSVHQPAPALPNGQPQMALQNSDGFRTRSRIIANYFS